MGIIPYNIFKPGNLVIVNGDIKDSSYGIGSLMFISNINMKITDQLNKPVTIVYDVVVIRKGKGGKYRLCIDSIATSVFTGADQTFTQHIPTDITGKINISKYVHLEKINTYSDIMKLHPVEFLGWCTSYGQYLLYVTRYAKHPIAWPEDKSDPINQLRVMVSSWESDTQGTLNKYAGNSDSRASLVSAIRRKDAELIQCSKRYSEDEVYRLYRAFDRLDSCDLGWLRDHNEDREDTRTFINGLNGIMLGNRNKKLKGGSTPKAASKITTWETPIQ